MSKSLKRLAALFVSIVGFSLNASLHAQATHVNYAISDFPAMETAIVARINVIRIRSGLRPLVQNSALARAARLHSQEMAQHNYFSHTDLRGRDVSGRVNAERYDWMNVGENIAMNMGYRDPLQTAVDGWMKSPGHRENILRSVYTETGVGVCRIGQTYYLTQVFGRPMDR